MNPNVYVINAAKVEENFLMPPYRYLHGSLFFGMQIKARKHIMQSRENVRAQILCMRNYKLPSAHFDSRNAELLLYIFPLHGEY